jgi:flagellar motor switch protein FliN
MTKDAAIPIDPQSAQLQRIWIDCLFTVIGQVAGFPVTVETSTETELAPKPSAAEQKPAGMEIAVAKALQGNMALLTSEEGALTLAQVLVSEPVDISVPFDKDRRDAFEELLRQVLGQVATTLKKATGGEVELKPTGSAEPSWTAASRMGIRIKSEKFEAIQLVLLVNEELLKSLVPPPETTSSAAPSSSAAPPAAPPAVPPAAPKADTSAQESATRSSNLELLLDVRLEATIRFGQKQMLLREILELHPGTAVALDRQVEEPVELLVGGRVVAQGDVVIVDGNYGLRITAILTPQKRVEALGKEL